MFKKILIANRGEIACRINRTAQRLGIATVAVYSTADARALHVRMADEAVHIGPSPAAQSYLSMERIIEACKRTQADAVHPGYGFLSEQASFANALAAEGIVFIGPNPRAMEAMGDKIESKKLASAANVSTVAGHIGSVSNGAEAARIAKQIGYPVMIKASAGGGGKGMRIAYSAAEMDEALERARAEAASAFGDDRVFIEKYIVNPRHIEIQILGDKRGNIIHLGERECSIQRRNQKIVEEAPSPLLDEATRQAMCEQAIKLARAVNYDSAGTVEFVAGQDRSFYFLEMNTRLQVEHPVTELVTGTDLVEQMIRIAAGESLALKQGDVQSKGWAIESRIYAEDPFRGFMPSSGRLKTYRPPKEGQSARGVTVRLDSGVYEGGEIPVYYDPIIAKLVVHAGSRPVAIEAMAAALDTFYIDGIRHNIQFLAAVMGNKNWRSGNISTGFIESEFPSRFMGVSLDRDLELKLLAVAGAMDHRESERRHRVSGQLTPRRIKATERRVVKLADKIYPIELTQNANGLSVVHKALNNALVVRSKWAPGQPVWQGEINDEFISVQVERLPHGYRLEHRGASVTANVQSERQLQLARLVPPKTVGKLSHDLRCPMPGLVVSILVTDGQDVKAGDSLAVIEAMKMQNVLRAERDCRVKNLRAAPGDTLAFDAVIMEFE
jgi:propionyl-CoA carboxylase alpha chain